MNGDLNSWDKFCNYLWFDKKLNIWLDISKINFTYEEIKKMENSKPTYWQNAERTNGRMAMMGLFALVVNYGLFGWIIPGIF